MKRDYPTQQCYCNSEYFQPRKTWGDTRKGLTSKINEICQQLFGLNREELGIIAGTRATMLYEGKSYPVEIDNVEELAIKGIAIIIIEKEGIADLLAQFAERYRVALVHTRGRFTEYGKDLIEAAKKAGSVVGILVDYDAYGEEIAKGSRTDTPKIGITRDTIKWLQYNGYPDLTEAEIEEEYSPAIYTSDDYLKTKRIELDSIAAKVGAAGLWKYILHRLQSPEIAPQGFDLNQAVTIPANEVFYPKAVSDLLTYLNNYTDRILSEEREVIELELEDIRELTEIKSEEKDIEERLRMS